MTKEIIIQTTVNELNSLYCVYELLTVSNKPATHIGFCKLQELFSQKLPINKTDQFMLYMTGTYNNGTDAINAAHAAKHGRKLIMINYCNVGKRVRCVETGEIFDNCAELIRIRGVSQSALSNHLNGKKYSKTVKGRRYERF